MRAGPDRRQPGVQEDHGRDREVVERLTQEKAAATAIKRDGLM
jgi:hypothetical protein